MNICVFCSSSNAVEKSYFNEATRLGERLSSGGLKANRHDYEIISAKNIGEQKISGHVVERGYVTWVLLKQNSG